MYKNAVNDMINYLSTGAGFLPSTVAPLLGEDSQFEKYFHMGLKPATS